MSPRLRITLGFWITAAFLFLGGCDKTLPPPPTALVPIREACVPADFPKPPATYADDTLPPGADHLVDRFRLRSSANEARKARLAVVEPVIASCR